MPDLHLDLLNDVRIGSPCPQNLKVVRGADVISEADLAAGAPPAESRRLAGRALVAAAAICAAIIVVAREWDHEGWESKLDTLGPFEWLIQRNQISASAPLAPSPRPVWTGRRGCP